MSARYGQKVLPSANKKAYTGTAAKFRPAPTPYERRSDYLTMPTIANTEQKVALLVFISNDNSNFLSLIVAGNYTVDWGDGVVENINTGVQANHIYDFATYDPTNSTLTTDGFKQAIVIITPQAGSNLTGLNLVVRHPSTTGFNAYAQPIIEAYVSCPNATSLAFSFSATSVFCRKTSYINLINTGSITLFSNLFNLMSGLQKVDIGKTAAITNTQAMFQYCYSLKEITVSNDTNFSSITNTSSMFSTCYSLINVPLFNTRSVGSMNFMFQDCRSLISVPLFDTRSATTMTNMFRDCRSLISVPLFNTVNVLTISDMFVNCYGLTAVPLFDTRSVTTMANMFSSCISLSSVPLLNTINVTTMNGMFYECRSLTTVPLFDTTKVTIMSNMFISCSALRTVPLFNTANVTAMDSMFNGCISLTTVPLFNTIKVTTMASMFLSCVSLVNVPLFNTPALTNISGIFANCAMLKTIPLLNTENVTNTSSMVNGCVSLTSIPLFNTTKVTNMNSMFQNCYSLKSVPLFDTANVLSMRNMFTFCYSLMSVPLFNTVKVTDMYQMFASCVSLTFLPSLNTSLVTLMEGMVNNCPSLTAIPSFNVTNVSIFNAFTGNACYSVASLLMTNVKYTLDINNCKLSKQALETFFTNLGTATAGATRTLTLTNNWGAPTPVSLNGTTTEGSVTIAMASTTGLSTGMQVTGTNTPLTTGETVTFTDAGDLVSTVVAHGLSDGDEVSFSAITTTTGIVINTIYFVVNATTNTFQVAASVGGAALPLTNNGSGTVKYNSTIVSINPNVSVTMSRPMVGNSGTLISLSFRLLQTYKAVLKGFAITG
jgi:surface protein